MGRPANSFSVPREQMIRHMIMKRQLEEAVPVPVPPGVFMLEAMTQAAQMPTTPSTLSTMSQNELDRGFGALNDGREAGMAAMQENDMRLSSPASSSVDMLPARAAQMRQEEQFRQFLRGNQ